MELENLPDIDPPELDVLLDCLFSCSAIVPNDMEAITQLQGKKLGGNTWPTDEELAAMHPAWCKIAEGDVKTWHSW